MFYHSACSKWLTISCKTSWNLELTHCSLREMAVISKVYICNIFQSLISWMFPVVVSSKENHRISLMISQHWFREWLDAIRQQAMTWTNIDQDLRSHMRLQWVKTQMSEFYYPHFEIRPGWGHLSYREGLGWDGLAALIWCVVIHITRLDPREYRITAIDTNTCRLANTAPTLLVLLYFAIIQFSSKYWKKNQIWPISLSQNNAKIWKFNGPWP